MDLTLKQMRKYNQSLIRINILSVEVVKKRRCLFFKKILSVTYQILVKVLKACIFSCITGILTCSFDKFIAMFYMNRTKKSIFFINTGNLLYIQNGM